MTENEIELVKKQYRKEGCTLLLKKSESTLCFFDSGIKPLVDLIDKKTNVQSFFAVDKIVGKAAAFLYTILGVKGIFAFVTTKDALEILQSANIPIYYETLVTFIKNRSGTGLCPMEETVQNVKDARVALLAIKAKMAFLSSIVSKIQ